jgi:hypothetical protein
LRLGFIVFADELFKLIDFLFFLSDQGLQGVRFFVSYLFMFAELMIKFLDHGLIVFLGFYLFWGLFLLCLQFLFQQ